MAKSKYEKKITEVLQGVLDETDDGKLIITVETKNGFEEYDVLDMLRSNLGCQVSITSES